MTATHLACGLRMRTVPAASIREAQDAPPRPGGVPDQSTELRPVVPGSTSKVQAKSGTLETRKTPSSRRESLVRCRCGASEPLVHCHLWVMLGIASFRPLQALLQKRPPARS